MAVGVSTTITPPPSAGGAPTGDSRTYFAAGLTQRGDTVNPIVLHSWAEALDLLGPRTSYSALADDLQTFFAESADTGARAIVCRAVGPSATKGSLSLADGSSVATLTVAAKDEGSWSSGVTVEVQGGLLTNTFTIVVSYQGTQVEKFPNLASPADAVTALLASGYVRGTNLGSATAAPGNNPAVLAATALPAGTDDRASVSATVLLAALNRAGADLGPGICAIPGQAASTVAAGLAAHAVANGRTALVAPAAGTAVSAAGPAARALRSTTGAERLAFLYPWITIPDGSGAVRTISPEGFVAGRRAAAITDVGPWRAPAGVAGAARFASGVELRLTGSQINTLADDAVSAIRLIGSGPRLYGWRSLSADEVSFRFLSTMDLLNDIAWRTNRVLEPYVFAPVDSQGLLLGGIQTDVEGLLSPMAEAGGLYARDTGAETDPGFKVDVGPAVNSVATLARGEIHVQISVRDSPVGELIRVFLTKVPLTAAF